MQDEYLAIPRWMFERLRDGYRRALAAGLIRGQSADGLQTDDCEVLLTLLSDAMRGEETSYSVLEERWKVGKKGVWNAKRRGGPASQELLSMTAKLAGFLKGENNCEETGRKLPGNREGTNSGENGRKTRLEETGRKPAGNHEETRGSPSPPTPPSSPKGNSPPSPTETSPPRGVDLPVWVDPGIWKAFRQLRDRIRAPLTDHAAKLILRRLEGFRSDGHDPNAILDQSIERGWRGVFPVKTESGSSAGSPHGSPAIPAAARAARAGLPPPPADSLTESELRYECATYELDPSHFERCETSEGPRWTFSAKGRAQKQASLRREMLAAKAERQAEREPVRQAGR